MAKHVFGIDLGTTYSCIAYVDESGLATVIQNGEGKKITPSVVCVKNPENIVVGDVAKEDAIMEPDSTISFVKNVMGKTDVAMVWEGQTYSPEQISSFILKKLVNDAANQLGEEVKDVVITCPAYFGAAEKTATKNAGIIAGLNVLEIINEPTAAALFYGCAKEKEEKTILVYDLGGGTFDVTIMRISSDKIEVVCSDGDHSLGGKDWDDRLQNYVLDEFSARQGFDGEFGSDVLQEVRQKVEDAKMRLTQKTEHKITLNVDGIREQIEITRDLFDELTKDLLTASLNKTDDAIAIAESKGCHIDEILLVGGSTRMPQVRKAIDEKYGPISKFLEPDEAVAKGAAIHAVNVYVNNQKSLASDAEGETTVSIGGVEKEINADDYKEELAVDPKMMAIGGTVRKVISATTKSYAVEVINNSNQSYCNNLIIKNTPMPDGSVTESRIFGTHYDNQESAEIKVYESDFMETNYDVDEDYLLGTAILELSGKLPAGSGIEIVMTLNTEGILEVNGKECATGNEVHATMHATGIMSKEDVEELKEKSKGIVIM